MKIKKILNSLLLAVLVFSICVPALGGAVVAAGVFDKAIKMEALEFYQVNLKKNENKYYRVTAPADGTINFSCKTVDSNVHIVMMNSNAEELKDIEIEENITHTYAVKKGMVYYFRIYNSLNWESYITDLYYNFTPDDKPTISLKITLKKGASLQLGSIVENSKEKVEWLSTKKNIATVSSKGLVKAVKKGTTTIRASLADGSGTYAEIKVVVTE